MAFGNYYNGMGYQPGAFMPGGAVPDVLGQYKTPYQPQPQPQQPAQHGGNGLIWVQGETGAKSFIVAPGQSALLMDSESSRFYLKSADASGMPLPLRIFEYSEVTVGAPTKETPTPTPKYVTWEEFEARLSRLENVKEEPVNE